MSKKKSRQSLAVELKPFVAPFCFDGSGEFHLKSHKTHEKGGLDKDKGEKIIEANRKRLSDFQAKLVRAGQLVAAADLSGHGRRRQGQRHQERVRRHQPAGLPGGIRSRRRRPTELDHDFMWRSTIALPERGRIGIFNRSYYEEVLVVRVHPEILAKQKIPPPLVNKTIWRERFEDISAFERYLARNGTVVLKFFLNVSKEEQRQRFLDRLEEPSKNWKFSMADVTERALWDKYQAAYQDMIRHTSTQAAPWHVVPADHKWFARVVIGSTIVSALDRLDLQFPKVDAASLAGIQESAGGAGERGQGQGGGEESQRENEISLARRSRTQRSTSHLRSGAL